MDSASILCKFLLIQILQGFDSNFDSNSLHLGYGQQSTIYDFLNKTVKYLLHLSYPRNFDLTPFSSLGLFLFDCLKIFLHVFQLNNL